MSHYVRKNTNELAKLSIIIRILEFVDYYIMFDLFFLLRRVYLLLLLFQLLIYCYIILPSYKCLCVKKTKQRKKDKSSISHRYWNTFQLWIPRELSGIWITGLPMCKNPHGEISAKVKDGLWYKLKPSDFFGSFAKEFPTFISNGIGMHYIRLLLGNPVSCL